MGKMIVRSAAGGGKLMETLPQGLVLEIMGRLDLESLCSLAPVCKALRCSVSQSFSSISTLDLSDLSPTTWVLNRILSNNKVLKTLILDCRRLDDYSVEVFAKESIQELVLLRCFMFSSFVFTAIAEKCPKIRMFTVEMRQANEHESAGSCHKAIGQMLDRCLYLESVSIKFHADYSHSGNISSIQLTLPKNVKALLLQPISDWQAKVLIQNIGVDGGSHSSLAGVGISSFEPMFHWLQSLSLVLNNITDELIFNITNNLHQLVELCLEDNPPEEPSLMNDLTNGGLQSLGTFRNLIGLSLSRNRSSLTTFKRNLKRLQIVNAFFLSDLAFHDLADAPNSLVEVRLISCNLITGETAESLSVCRNLQVLDFSGCKSIADIGLNSISRLSKLTTLDLCGADITDSGLSALGGGSSPIVSLCLRGCKRITDRGIVMMLHGDGVLGNTLLTLDLGYLPGVSDTAVVAVAKVCRQIINLCIRNCFAVTDTSISALGSPERSEGKRSLRKLDLYNCCGLSAVSFRLLRGPFFCGLRWLGVGSTKLLADGKYRFIELGIERPGLSICISGCEIGCKDGWQCHECI
uniref:F-box/LRR-repeat protein 15-like leucin rich repeat domain-containing protein n=1 Tax=Musa acuminata subsp. malaccensis TaxID=214687 RepID=A0A804KPI9_MUSAM|nr:PREDICTED: F-box protein At-B isoform X3 [Musa acuminata subsp. malaccensis]